MMMAITYSDDWYNCGISDDGGNDFGDANDDGDDFNDCNDGGDDLLFITVMTMVPGGVLNFELGTDVRPEVSTTTL